MKPVAAQVSLLSQIAGGTVHLYDRINALLAKPDLVRFRAAVAYARWDGLGLISENLERHLAAGGEFQCIYGVNNGVTTPDSFLYSLYLQELYDGHTYAGAVEDKYANATFHPKFFEFQFEDETVAIVGSANLTGGGLVRNSELGAEIHIAKGSALLKSIDLSWAAIEAEGEPIDLDKVRNLKFKKELGSEADGEDEEHKKSTKPFLKSTAKIAPKPLFHKILDLEEPKKKTKLLSGLDPLTERPKRLFLEIFETETGGQGGRQGYQIQLPAATLAAYFGVGPYEDKTAKFEFGSDLIETHFTHFYNNTHRLRLQPILQVERPAILEFERIAEDAYRCKIYPKKLYAKVLAEKCDQQTRAGARRWGME